jgi:pantoate--beta-alanine ligase
MDIFRSGTSLRSHLLKLRNEGKNCIGFVPTMGALHNGHMELVRRSKAECDVTVVSVFVNPTQFNDASDLDKYPRTLPSDIELLLQEHTEVLFAPDYNDVYGDDYEERKLPDLAQLENTVEGALRPGHFKGVAQVVLRLFELVSPDKAYFGQKDYQQILVIKHLIYSFSLPIELIMVPIVREANGLAMSSRNTRLPENSRKKAGFIYRNLLQLQQLVHEIPIQKALNIIRKQLSEQEGATVEYLIAVDADTLKEINSLDEANAVIALVVVRYYEVRLLDNICLKQEEK